MINSILFFIPRFLPHFARSCARICLNKTDDCRDVISVRLEMILHVTQRKLFILSHTTSPEVVLEEANQISEEMHRCI